MESFKNVLIVAAHPDDEVLGAGGFLSKYSHLNYRVVFLAEGTTARYSKEDIDCHGAKKNIALRRLFCINALKNVGIKGSDIYFYDNPACRLDTVSLLELGKIVEFHISDFRPDTIITHSNVDVNIDHRTTLQAVIQATRPAKYDFVKTILMFEILSSTEWKFIDTFKPNFFIKLNKDQIEKKANMFLQYRTESSKYPHPRSVKGIKTLAGFRGMQSGTEYAESFEILRAVM